MRTYHVLDEQQRIREIYFTNEDRPDEPQVNTHTFSYMYAREFYRSMGDVMGLDRGTELTPEFEELASELESILGGPDEL